MKKTVLTLSVLATVIMLIAGCGPQQTKRDITPLTLTAGGDDMTEPLTFFDDTSVTVAGEEQTDYLYGDVNGLYYKNTAHAYALGDGLVSGGETLLADFGSSEAGSVNDRTVADHTELFIYGARTVYEDGLWDELLLHPKSDAVSLTVHSDTAEILTLVPLFPFDQSEVSINNYGNVIVFYVAEMDLYVAFAANQLFKMDTGKVDKMDALMLTFGTEAGQSHPCFTTTEEVNDFTLYIAFADDEEDAMELADDLANEDSVTLRKQAVYDFFTMSYFSDADQIWNYIDSGMNPEQSERVIESLQLVGAGSPVLEPQAFFDAMAIVITNGSAVQYIFGDNLSGYFEGYTYSYKKGVGYMLDESTLYHDFGSYAGGFDEEHVNDRNDATKALIYPYGSRSYFGEGVWEEFIMHNRQHAVSISVHSDTPQILSLVPILNFLNTKVEYHNYGNVITYSFIEDPQVDYPAYVAISATKLFDFVDADESDHPEMKDTFKMKKNMSHATFTTREAETDFTVYVAFGYSEEDAIEKADELANADSVTLQKQAVYDNLTKSYLWTDDMEYNRALMWSKHAAYQLVEEEFGKGIWAGLSWFKQNWGRDTFIALPGTLLISGHFQEAMDVMTNFSTFQNRGQLSLEVFYDEDEALKEAAREVMKTYFGNDLSYKSRSSIISASPTIYYLDHMDELSNIVMEIESAAPGVTVTMELSIGSDIGRIPNRVSSMDNIIYNTTDGTPWFIREIYEYLRYTGNKQLAADIYPVVKRAIEGSVTNYVDDEGFLTHDDADTWMDARISGADPWSARGNRAVEIQALWYESLRIGAYLARYNGEDDKATEWDEIADSLKDNFLSVFWDEDNKIMADRVRDDDTADYKVRPNQLMLISVPFEDHLVKDAVEALVMKNAVSDLLYPYGIASLSQDDPYFHPYHENWDFYEKDAAYHNGTVWGWNAGFTVTAMTRFGYTELAYELTENLAEQILHMGTRGSMSEVMDAIQENYEDLVLTGTYSQAWSVSEFARNGYQDFAGFRPNLLENTVDLIPAIPESWNNFDGVFAFDGSVYDGDAKFKLMFERVDSGYRFKISTMGYTETLTVNLAPLATDKARYQVSFTVQPGVEKTILFDTASGTATVDGAAVSTTVYLESYADSIGELEFVVPNTNEEDYEVLQDKDVIKTIIQNGEFE